MRPNAIVREKMPVPVEPEKAPDAVQPATDAPIQIPQAPVEDREAAYVLRYRLLQEEAAARERALVAELEEKHETLFKRLEASFAEKERRLTEELTAKHLAEARRLELASADREHTLLEQLGVARRLLTVTMIAFFLLAAAVVYSRMGHGAAPHKALKPAGSKSTAPEVMNALMPHLAAPEAAWSTPAVLKSADKALAEAKTAGNGGNFVRGSSAGK